VGADAAESEPGLWAIRAGSGWVFPDVVQRTVVMRPPHERTSRFVQPLSDIADDVTSSERAAVEMRCSWHQRMTRIEKMAGRRVIAFRRLGSRKLPSPVTVSAPVEIYMVIV